MDKLISVIIPVYNVEQYLDRCLESVIKNTYKSLEIICVNDGSTDNSLNVLRKYEKADKRIIIVDQENKGISAARNAGLEIASGENVAFIDSDDWVHPRYFEILLQMQEEYKTDIAVCRYSKTKTKNDFQKITYSSRQKKVLNLRQALDDTRVKSAVWGRIYSSNILKGLRFQNVEMAEDVLFNVCVLCQDVNVKVSLIEQNLYFYYIRENSMVHKNHASKSALIGEWYLAHYVDFQNESIRNIILEEGIKSALNYRYLTMFLNDKEIKKRKKEFIDLALKNIKICTSSKKIIWRIFILMPVTYRIFRILQDKTMLEWEKQQKRFRYTR